MMVSRAERDGLVESLAALPDTALAAPVAWDGAERPLAAMITQLLAAEVEARLELAAALDAAGWHVPAAVRHLQWAPIARARLEASLIGVPAPLFDGHPFAGEWSVCQQLAHVELTDERYAIACRYSALRSEDGPLLPPPELYPSRRGSPTGEPGEVAAAIIARMRTTRDQAIAPLLSIKAETLLRSTEWHTAEHTLGFRLHRFAAHDLELTADIRRTLAALGHQPTRAMRLAGALVESWGELEAVLLGVPEHCLDAVLATGLSPRQQLNRLYARDRDSLACVRGIQPAEQQLGSAS